MQVRAREDDGKGSEEVMIMFSTRKQDKSLIKKNVLLCLQCMYM